MLLHKFSCDKTGINIVKRQARDFQVSYRNRPCRFRFRALEFDRCTNNVLYISFPFTPPFDLPCDHLLYFFLSSWAVKYDYVHQRRSKFSLLLPVTWPTDVVAVLSTFFKHKCKLLIWLTLYNTLITKELGNIFCLIRLCRIMTWVYYWP